MKQLLFTLVLSEMVLILTLLFRTPLRTVVMMGLDRVKQGRGPIMAQTVAATLIVVLGSSLYSLMIIQKRSMDGGRLNPTDQVLQANHILEASLMGFSLFLAIMVDRLHYYIKEINVLRKSLEVLSKKNKGYEGMKNRGIDDSKAFEEEIKTKKKQPESESNRKMKEANPKDDKVALKGEIKKT